MSKNRDNFLWEAFRAKADADAVTEFLKVGLFLAVMAGLILLALCIPAHAAEKQYSDIEIVQAIWYAEGGKDTNFPYGIRSVSCEGLDECRQVCLNTVRNNRKRYADYGHKKYDTYLEFLSSRYAPTQGKDLTKDEKRLNAYWLNNVKFFLKKGVKSGQK